MSTDPDYYPHHTLVTYDADDYSGRLYLVDHFKLICWINEQNCVADEQQKREEPDQ